MAVFRCERFPEGEVPVRTAAGLVWFTDGRADVTDPEVAAALREVPEEFGITEDEPKRPAKTASKASKAAPSKASGGE